MKIEHKINRCLYQYLSLDDYEQEKVSERVNELLDNIIEVLDNPNYTHGEKTQTFVEVEVDVNSLKSINDLSITASDNIILRTGRIQGGMQNISGREFRKIDPSVLEDVNVLKCTLHNYADHRCYEITVPPVSYDTIMDKVRGTPEPSEITISKDNPLDNCYSSEWKPLVDCGYFRNFVFDDKDDVYHIIDVEDKSVFTIYGEEMDSLNFGDLQYIFGKFTKGMRDGKDITIYDCNVSPKDFRKITEMHVMYQDNQNNRNNYVPPVVEQEVCHTGLGDIVRPIKPTYTSLYERKYDELDIQSCDRVIVHNISYTHHFFTSNKVDLECRRHIKELDVNILKYSVTSYDGYAQFDLWVSNQDYELLGDTRPLVKKCPLNTDTIVKFTSDDLDETRGVEFGFIRNEDKFKTLRYNDASFKNEYVLFKVDKEEIQDITDFIMRIEGEDDE